MSKHGPPEPRKGRPAGSKSFAWRAFFHHAATPVFVLGKGKRLRYANPAWEKLAGTTLAESLGLVCSTRRHATPLAAALAPSPEVLAGRTGTVRRPAPPLRTGPPWWDVTFAPLAGDDGLYGLVGFIAVVGEAVPAAARKIPAVAMELREKHARRYTFDLFGGKDAASARFATRLRLASKTTAPVWLVGESGSGKETAARVIHHAGDRRERMFVAFDCAGLQPHLIEATIFGHGGLAHTDRLGTLYLKDPAALPRDFQQRIVEFVGEDKPTAPRLICGSPRTAANDVRSGKLLPAFDAELSVLELHVPPLRVRVSDLGRVVRSVLEWGTPPKATPPALDPAFLDTAARYPWPGNVRELRDVLAGAVATGATTITRDHLPYELKLRAGAVTNPPAASLKLAPILEAVEKRLIVLALRKAGGNATKAAEMLGIWRARLLRRVEALGIKFEDG